MLYLLMSVRFCWLHFVHFIYFFITIRYNRLNCLHWIIKIFFFLWIILFYRPRERSPFHELPLFFTIVFLKVKRFRNLTVVKTKCRTRNKINKTVQPIIDILCEIRRIGIPFDEKMNIVPSYSLRIDGRLHHFIQLQARALQAWSNSYTHVYLNVIHINWNYTLEYSWIY